MGLILKPNDDLCLELYADADFCGLWTVGKANDPISVRSRMGFIVTLAGLPVSWSSKLQTKIIVGRIYCFVYRNARAITFN
eukprot:4996917-Ditylum_brightwellii.AAC.2